MLYRIVVQLNKLLESLNLPNNASFRRTLRNFAVDLSIVDPRSFSGVTFSGTITGKITSPLRSENIAKELSDNTTDLGPEATTLRLLRTLFDNAGAGRQRRTVVLALYKETKFFQVIPLRPPTNLSQRLNSFVIAGSIKGQFISNLTNPVVLTYKNLKPGNKNSSFCGFWNFAEASWSDEGCSFQGVQEDGRIVCHCNHLTNFAMLMVCLLVLKSRTFS